MGRGCLYSVGMNVLVVLACESLHVCSVCIWRSEHTRFCVEVSSVFVCHINFHSFIHSAATWFGADGH